MKRGSSKLHCQCGDPGCVLCSMHYATARVARVWNLIMLSKAKARAILWLYYASEPITIDEWARKVHRGTSDALRADRIICANVGSAVVLTAFGHGVAAGLAFGVSKPEDLADAARFASQAPIPQETSP